MTTPLAASTQPIRRPAPRHLLGAEDFEELGLTRLLDRADRLRTDRHGAGLARPLAGRQVALLFEKPSLRTRVSFEVAVTGLGGSIALEGQRRQGATLRIEVPLASYRGRRRSSGSLRRIEPPA